MSRPPRPRITIITPVFNEEAALRAYEAAVGATLLVREDAEYHVLFVDDGSTDGSWPLIQEICARSPRFRGLRLSRNFGPHVAITAGIDHCDGDAVAILACDLQDPPEIVLEFVERWRAGAEIVWGARRTRQDKRWRVWISNAFFHAIRRWAMPRHSKFTTGSFLLLDRTVADCFRQFREHSRVTFALVAWTGFDQDTVPYDRRSRVAGASGWTFARLLRAAYDTFIGFSEIPARAITVLGAVVFVLSMLSTLYLLLTWLLTDVMLGWTGIMVTITTLFGLLFIMVGTMAEYLQRIFIEATGRPLYFISRRTGGETPEPVADGSGANGSRVGEHV